MAVFKLIFFLIFIIFEVKSECYLNIKNTTKSAVFAIKLNNTLSSLKDIEKSGQDIFKVKFKNQDVLKIACPGINNTLKHMGESRGHVRVITAQCVNGRMMKDNLTDLDLLTHGNMIYQCKETPKPVKRQSTEFSCDPLIKVGYEIENNFLEVYEACFDRNKYRTNYVKYTLNPSSSIQMKLSYSKHFVDSQMTDVGKLFQGLKMADLYNNGKFSQFLKTRFGNDIVKKFNLTISRGHLAAANEFTMNADRVATYDYINTAPQWLAGNQGEWRKLESSIAKLVVQNKSEVTAYTGTFRTLTFDTYSGPKNVCLNFSRTEVIPVPLYFYKLIYNSVYKTASAFVWINLPVYNRELVKNLTLCNNVCNKLNISWNIISNSQGFCCTYSEFTSKIQNFNLTVTDLWGVKLRDILIDNLRAPFRYFNLNGNNSKKRRTGF